VTLNIALYSEDFRNFQTTALDASITPPAFILTNAGLLRARGVEGEATWQAAAGLVLSASAAYNDAKYRDYLGPCYAGQPVSATVGVGCYAIPSTTTQVANYAGYPLPNAPRWSYTLRADYSRPLGGGLELQANGNWAWREATQAVIGDPNARVPAYGLLNGSIALAAEDGRWRVSVYARNLLDKHFYAPYSAGVINPGGYSMIVPPEAFRTFGVDLSLRFR
jgi:iron complex outermembrane receptor protein